MKRTKKIGAALAGLLVLVFRYNRKGGKRS